MKNDLVILDDGDTGEGILNHIAQTLLVSVNDLLCSLEIRDVLKRSYTFLCSGYHSRGCKNVFDDTIFIHKFELIVPRRIIGIDSSPDMICFHFLQGILFSYKFRPAFFTLNFSFRIAGKLLEFFVGPGYGGIFLDYDCRGSGGLKQAPVCILRLVESFIINLIVYVFCHHL